jgi:hypothetical protein
MYWQHFINCLDAVQPCKQLTSVVVTKILHRKRPELVPINDTLVRAFYGAKNSYASLFKAIRADVTNEETQALLDKCREGRRTTDGRDMSRLRALDIIVWMHMKDRHLQK